MKEKLKAVMVFIKTAIGIVAMVPVVILAIIRKRLKSIQNKNEANDSN